MASSPILLLIMATIAVFGLSAADNSLNSPNTLHTNRVLTKGCYTLIMQTDCNLVLYIGTNGTAIWHTNTARRGVNCRLTLLNNGNLVINDENGRQIWQTRTIKPTDHYVLVLQQDGNLVIYGPAIWATGTDSLNGVTVGPHNTTASVDAVAEQVIVSAVDGAMVK